MLCHTRHIFVTFSDIALESARGRGAGLGSVPGHPDSTTGQGAAARDPRGYGQLARPTQACGRGMRFPLGGGWPAGRVVFRGGRTDAGGRAGFGVTGRESGPEEGVAGNPFGDGESDFFASSQICCSVLALFSTSLDWFQEGLIDPSGSIPRQRRGDRQEGEEEPGWSAPSSSNVCGAAGTEVCVYRWRRVRSATSFGCLRPIFLCFRSVHRRGLGLRRGLYGTATGRSR